MSGMIKFYGKLLNAGLITGLAAITCLSQASPAKGGLRAEESFLGSNGVFLGIIGAAIIGVAAIYFFRRNAAGDKGGKVNRQEPKQDEIKITYRVKSARPAPVQKIEVLAEEAPKKSVPAVPDLPIYSFVRLERTAKYDLLPESSDEDLLCAIEQTQEEFDEDAEVRFLALKVVAAFRASNAVQAIAQMALYDLSSKLRSNAVTMLADIDHETVFEPIVNACADPTREVRAAAARGLFRLNFDRAQAWTRIIESGNEGRMRQATRAAIEGDLVERSFDRLVHKDRKVAYEAFALTSLLIKAGEAEPIYRALAVHKDEAVKLALLHVLQTINDESTFESLSNLLTNHNLTPNVAAKVNEVRSYAQLMSV
jgi:HEAT repeats